MPTDDAPRADPATSSPPVEEVSLVGGNSTSVARRGGAVHRTAGPWTPTVHRLLEHLHAHGVDFVPRALGFDEQGREVLTYLPGIVPAYPLTAHVWTPAVLATAARQLGEVHAATATFPAGPPHSGSTTAGSAVWQQPAHQPAEVVCINDVAPYNMVFDEAEALSGWIDIDATSPGPRVWDLAHLAYRMVPLTGEHDCGAGAPDLARYRRRLGALCQAYSTAGDEVEITPAQVLPVVADRLLALAADADARLAEGAGHLAGYGELYRREGAWLAAHADQLAQPPAADLVVVTGPIASGKSTTATALATAATAHGLTAVVLDVDDVAQMVAAPGAGAAGLWFSAHQAHGALVARWVATPIDLVIAVGPIYSTAEQAALLEQLPAGIGAHWVVLHAPVAITLARAQGDLTRGLSREAAFHHGRHQRFQRLVADLPAAQTFETTTSEPATIASEILAALRSR